MDDLLDLALARANTYSAFLDHQHHLCTDRDLAAVVEAAHGALAEGRALAVTVFHDATGNRTEVEPGADAAALRARLEPASVAVGEKREGPGRPKLGVVSREVSLLPRHWEWLAGQSGGASAALRRLVDRARKEFRARDAARINRDGVYRALVILGGDLPGFEEASRALYAEDFGRLATLTQDWPEDLRAHVARLAEVASVLSELARAEAAARPT